jgi:hypothetical protein
MPPRAGPRPSTAHLLRELVARQEQQPLAWADELATLLVALQDLVATARATGQDRLDEALRLTLDAHDDHLLDQGDVANPRPPPSPEGAPPPRPRHGWPKQTTAPHRLARRDVHRRDVLAFLADCRVLFDHHQAERDLRLRKVQRTSRGGLARSRSKAERDLRLRKVQQQISGGFRSRAGATAFARIRGDLSTLRSRAYRSSAPSKASSRAHPWFPPLQARQSHA